MNRMLRHSNTFGWLPRQNDTIWLIAVIVFSLVCLLLAGQEYENGHSDPPLSIDQVEER